MSVIFAGIWRHFVHAVWGLSMIRAAVSAKDLGQGLGVASLFADDDERDDDGVLRGG
jgi:hypothetical protein